MRSLDNQSNTTSIEAFPWDSNCRIVRKPKLRYEDRHCDATRPNVRNTRRKTARMSIYRNDVGHVSLGTRHHVAWADSKLESPSWLSVFRVVGLVWLSGEHSYVEEVEPETLGYSSKLGP